MMFQETVLGRWCCSLVESSMKNLFWGVFDVSTAGFAGVEPHRARVGRGCLARCWALRNHTPLACCPGPVCAGVGWWVASFL